MTTNGDGTPRSHHLRPVDPEPPFDPHEDTPLTGRAPADRAAEQALLATLIHDTRLAPELRNHLTPDDFYWPAHATLWATIHDLTADGTDVDSVVLNAHLVRHKNTEAARLLADLHPLPTKVNPALATQYAALVRDQARLRAVDQTATRLRDLAARGNPDNIDQVMETAVEALDQAFNRFGPSLDQSPTHTWTPLDLEQVLEGHEVDPPPAILARDDGKHLMYAGAVHTISGEPGSGKTWLTLLAALQQLQAGHNVAMIDFEDRASRVVARLLALGATPTQLRDHFRYIRPHNALDNTSRPDLQRAVTGTTLVILDGVTEAMTLHGLELEKNADVARFYDTLPRWIADHSGAAVAMVDHVVKDNEKQGRWALGGQHKLAGIDGVAYLVKAIEPFGRGKTGIARISLSKDRPGYIEEIALGRVVAELHLDARNINCLQSELLPPSQLPKDEAGNMRPTRLMERVSRWIELTPGANKSQILDGVTGKTNYKRRALDRLLQEGFVEVEIGPNREHKHRVVHPFREDDEEQIS